MVKPYDADLKQPVAVNLQAFIRWLLPGAKFIQLHPQKLDAVELELDILIEIIIHGQRMLVPLTRGGTERKLVEQTITTLEQHPELPDLSLIAFTLASLAMRREKNPDLDWLIRRASVTPFAKQSPSMIGLLGE